MGEHLKKMVIVVQFNTSKHPSLKSNNNKIIYFV